RQWLEAGCVALDFGCTVRATEARWDASIVARRPYIGDALWFSHVFGQLAIQAAAALQSPVGIYRCSNPECGRPFTPPGRRPKTGQRSFCMPCREDDLVAKRLSA